MSAPSRWPALAPFRFRGFRFQWPADLLTSWAFEMEMLILGWYMLVETGSVLMLTLYGALLYPGTLIAPMIGVMGDRVGQRNLLAGLRAIYSTLGATLMVLALTGTLTPTLVLVVAAVMGIFRPSDQGMRAALVADTVPPEQLVGAMAVSRTTSDIARITGALSGAGLFVALGIGFAYVVVTVFYLLGLLLTLFVSRAPQAHPAAAAAAGVTPRVSPWSDLKEGMLHVWTTPQLLAAMWLAFLANLAAFPLTNGLMPYVAREIYRVDQTGLGILTASCAAGALLGSILLGVFSARIRPGRMMVVYAFAWYAVLLVYAHTGAMASGLIALALAGMMQSLSLVPVTVVLLRTSGEKFRGRVMGVRMLAIYSLPIGLLISGMLVELVGFRETATLFALIGIGFTAMIGWRWRAALWPLDAPANAR